MAPTLTHEKSGRQVTVPEDAAGVYLENGWSVAGTAPASATQDAPYPEGEPTAKWKVKELEAYAAGKSLDLGSASKKDEILAVIAAATQKGATDAAADAGEGDTVPAAADDGAADQG